MEEVHRNIEKVKGLIKQQIVQNNIILLLLFVLFWYLAVKGHLFFYFGMLCVLLWGLAAISVYTLMTGKPVGTKSTKILQEFFKNRFGGKRWKRKKVIEIVIISVISVIITVILFVVDLNAVGGFSVFNAVPFLGGWAGYNIGEMMRLNTL